MAPPLQTRADSNLKDPGEDNLRGFDPLAVLGFSISEPMPDRRTLDARYRKLARIIGILHVNSPRLPFSLTDVNRARDNLRFDWNRIVVETRSYHTPRWNLTADEHDLNALLDLPAGAQAATQADPTWSSLQTPVGGSRRHASFPRRKCSVSKYTKREMPRPKNEEGEAGLGWIDGATKKSNETDAMQGQGRRQKKSQKEKKGGVVYVGKDNEIPGFVMVGYDRRFPRDRRRMVVMDLAGVNRGRYHGLELINERPGAYRLRRARYEDLDQLPRILKALKNTGEIALSRLYATREELKVYYRQRMAKRERQADGPTV